MEKNALAAMIALSATRPEGVWPEQLDLTAFGTIIGEFSPAARRITRLADAREIRDAIAGILLDQTDEHAAAQLDRLVSEHAIVPTVAAQSIGFRSLRSDPRSLVWSELLPPLMTAVATGRRHDIRRCASAPCITPFLAASAETAREYCCVRCATRDRVRRHRANTTASSNSVRTKHRE
ncbi:CGNR zinc finger domain-containing protein [Humidisolicoccus flavus]|uniref:CGNR zinc finger domain-containing protein n=1 Tax=Humidisolicoccus flavus TaxID=3111414 RepID=UPI003245D8CC